MTNSTMCGKCGMNPRAYTSGNTYCRACNSAAARLYRARHPERVKVAYRRGHLKSRYGITVERYDAMLAAQGGVCACCGRVPREERSLAVDHDHSCCPGRTSCGECVRALLCDDCNLLVGRFEQGHLDKVLAYLRAVKA